MTLQEYLSIAEVDASLPRTVMEIFEARQPRDLSEPLSQHRAALHLTPFDTLIELIALRYRWMRWAARLDEVNATLGDEPLPSDLVHQTRTPDGVDACARAVNGNDASVANALVAVWGACMEVALTDTVVHGALSKANHPRAAQYKAFVGEIGRLGDIEPVKWLEVRRGLRSSVLTLTWEHPLEALTAAIGEHAAALADLIGKKKPESFIKEHVLPHLDEAVEARFTTHCDEQVGLATAREYGDLLLVESVKIPPVGGVYVGTDRQRIGMAVLDKRGMVMTTAPIRPSRDWADRICRWVTDHKVKSVAIPAFAPAAKWLSELKEKLEPEFTRLQEVSPVGIIEARGIDDPVLRRVSPEEASAIIIARRAFRPIDEWCRIDPLKLGLAPFQAELDQDRLRELLQVVRERCIAQGQPMSTAPVNTGGLRGRSSAPLNPTVTGIRDLRPGLQRNGVITNVTKFGAFVNIGLRQVGLVHIS